MTGGLVSRARLLAEEVAGRFRCVCKSAKEIRRMGGQRSTRQIVAQKRTVSERGGFSMKTYTLKEHGPCAENSGNG